MDFACKNEHLFQAAARNVSARAILIAAFVLLALVVPSIHADSVVQGDHFSGPTPSYLYAIYVYTTAPSSGHECDGASVGATYINETAFGGSFSTNHSGWRIPIPTAYTGASIYLSLCRGGGQPLLGTYTTEINDSTTLRLDVGRVTANMTMHADFTSATKRWLACTSIGGVKLNDQTSAFSLGNSTYFFRNVTVGDYYVFAKDTDSNCNLDATVVTGRMINNSSVTDGYGVDSVFSPDVKVAGTIHTDFNSKQLLVQDASANLGFSSAIAAGAYTLYYDNPAAGTAVTIYAYTGSGFPTIASYDEKITGYTTTTLAGTVNELTYKVSGNLPDGAATVQTTIAGITYSVPVTGAAGSKVFALYIPASTPTLQFKDSGGSIIYNYTYAAPVGADTTLSLAKFYGTTHSNLDSTGTIQFFEGNGCTGTTNIQSVAVAPSSGAYSTYVIY